MGRSTITPASPRCVSSNIRLVGKPLGWGVVSCCGTIFSVCRLYGIPFGALGECHTCQFASQGSVLRLQFSHLGKGKRGQGKRVAGTARPHRLSSGLSALVSFKSAPGWCGGRPRQRVMSCASPSAHRVARARMLLCVSKLARWASNHVRIPAPDLHCHCYKSLRCGRLDRTRTPADFVLLRPRSAPCLLASTESQRASGQSGTARARTQRSRLYCLCAFAHLPSRVCFLRRRWPRSPAASSVIIDGGTWRTISAL